MTKKREPSKCFVKPSEFNKISAAMADAVLRGLKVKPSPKEITYTLIIHGRKELNMLRAALGLYEQRMPTEYEARMKRTPEQYKSAQAHAERRRYSDFQALFMRVYNLKGTRS